MPDGVLAALLKREHHEIDSGIATFIDNLDVGCVKPGLSSTSLDALRRHIYLEETFLFPPIREAGMIMPIGVMMREHGELWRTTGALTDLLVDRADYEQLRDISHRLQGQLEQHTSKEEPIIYPHADSDLPAQVSAEIARFIAFGRTPDGWVCRQAGR
ncbi:hemerythrin domain-containing protein [Mycolicibacterium sp. ELW1]|jgi:iron-sulfur cluster repair protein YtfE (RIC family)|uniref:hemerythrin domain-containing protein n=1 Tax=Mycobacteriaceae TaxID=1762 RepID=UPI0011EFD6DB|nr:hemerythrin domain-containing protein [Mycobacterium sp. ELW1]QEN14349.1 hemerythrin domain-containing protein [Mycobacterium sp. ELW1]